MKAPAIISKDEARRNGYEFFYTGKPCKRGHITYRRTQNSTCIECARIRSVRWRANNRQKHRSYVSQYKKKNHEWALKQSRKYHDKHRERLNEKHRIYKRNNRHIAAAWAMKRYVNEKTATPPWADLEKIKEIYKEAEEKTQKRGKEYQVDHIVPILGKNVCGLHVSYNLQVIPARINRIKGNKYED